MAAQAVLNISTLIIPVIRAIEATGGTATNEQIHKELVKLGLNEGEKNHLGGTRSELEYKTAWARSYLKVYGGLENPKRGVWKLTDKGRKIDESQTHEIVNYVVNQSRQANLEKRASKKVAPRLVKQSRVETSVIGNSSVSAIDQAKTILSLLDKGILSKAAANVALMRLGGS